MPPLLLCMLLLLSQGALGLELNDSHRQAVDSFWVLQDSEHQYNIETIQQLSADHWKSSEQSGINLGYTQDTVWIKFQLSNKSHADKNRLFDITYPLLDYVDVYESHGNSEPKNILSSGDRRPFFIRNFSHPHFVSSIILKANTQNTYFLKISSNSPIQAEFVMWTADGFQQYHRAQASANFFYLGLILCSAIFNLFIFLFIKEKVYLIYSMYAISLAILMASQQGIIFEYVLPSLPNLNNWLQLIFGGISISLTVLFNYSFLKLSPSSKSGKALIVMFFLPLLTFIISSTIEYKYAIQAIVIMGIVIVPSALIVGIINISKIKTKVLYISAWLSLITGVLVFLLEKIGIIPFSQLSNNSVQIGSTLELLIFAIALAKRIHLEKEIRIQAQQLIIDNSRQTAKLHEGIIYSATHHSITGLPNQSHFERWLNNKLTQQHHFTLVLFTLTRLQEANKTLGNEFSEQVLEVFSLRLNSEAASFDGIEVIDEQEDFHIATLSNDTLALLVRYQPDSVFLNAISSLHERINQPLTVESIEIEPCIHCAYAHYPEHGSHADILLRHAGIALDIGQENQERITQYAQEINPYNERRLKLMAELKHAIKNNTVELYYQPLVDTKKGHYIGAEALIRWPHNEYGLIMPDEFIEAAEQTGVIQALSLWVLRSGTKQLKNWIRHNPEFLLSINISVLNLQDQKFIEALHILLEDNQNFPKNMILEITETQMMTDARSAMKNLWALSEMGFHIAIDDFGTGYSNLAYLKKLPATELKIDKSFILNLEGDTQNQILVQTAIQMAHNLDLKVVAEGVESEHSRAILEEMGCDICQGFHFSRPVPLENFNRLLSVHRKQIG